MRSVWLYEKLSRSRRSEFKLWEALNQWKAEKTLLLSLAPICWPQDL